jgi:hypothetical protein
MMRFRFRSRRHAFQPAREFYTDDIEISHSSTLLGLTVLAWILKPHS